MFCKLHSVIGFHSVFYYTAICFIQVHLLQHSLELDHIFYCSFFMFYLFSMNICFIILIIPHLIIIYKLFCFDFYALTCVIALLVCFINLLALCFCVNLYIIFYEETHNFTIIRNASLYFNFSFHYFVCILSICFLNTYF